MAVKPFLAEGAVEVGWPIRRIALAVDFSPEARHAAALTRELARTLDAEVTILHFREKGLGHFASARKGETPEETLDLVTEIVTDLANAGITVDGDVEDSLPLEEAGPIARAAERFGAQLIVVGSRGLSTAGAFARGSVSHDLIHASKVPVLVVR